MNVSWKRTMSPLLPVVFGLRLAKRDSNVRATTFGSLRRRSTLVSFSASHRLAGFRMAKFAMPACGPAARALSVWMFATSRERSGMPCSVL